MNNCLCISTTKKLCNINILPTEVTVCHCFHSCSCRVALLKIGCGVLWSKSLHREAIHASIDIIVGRGHRDLRELMIEFSSCEIWVQSSCGSSNRWGVDRWSGPALWYNIFERLWLFKAIESLSCRHSINVLNLRVVDRLHGLEVILSSHLYLLRFT